MNIINLTKQNIASISTNLSYAVNTYTKHKYTSISFKKEDPFAFQHEIFWKDNKNLAKKIINESEVIHLNSVLFGLPYSTKNIFFNKTFNIFNNFLYKSHFIRFTDWGARYPIKMKKILNEKKILLHYHGGDLRRIMSWREKVFIKKNKLKAVVTVPDLLPYLENVEWLPIPIPTENPLFKPLSKRDDKIIKIVHSPTQRSIKKTNLLIDVVNHLKKKYDIELILIENMPYEECIKLKKQAHLCFDNIGFGSYAGCSIEAMCHEQPSLVYLNKVCLRQIKNISKEIKIKSPLINVGDQNQPSHKYLNKVSMGLAPPIITKRDFESLYNSIERLIINSSLRKKIGKLGRKWCIKVHGSKAVAEKIVKIYDSLKPPREIKF